MDRTLAEVNVNGRASSKNRGGRSRYIVMLVCCFECMLAPIGPAQSQSPSTRPANLTLRCQEMVAELLGTQDYPTLQRLPDQWRSTTDVPTRIEVVIHLLRKLHSPAPLQLANYGDMFIASRVGAKRMPFFGHGVDLRQDIFISSGRCAWAIERLLDCRLPEFTEQLSDDDVATRVKESYEAVIRAMVPTL